MLRHRCDWTEAAPAARQLSLPPRRHLRSRKPCDRHTEGRARDIVQTDLLAEADGGRITAMLPADAELDAFPGRPALLRGDPHQFADAVDVERHERILFDNPFPAIAFEKGARVVARDAK